MLRECPKFQEQEQFNVKYIDYNNINSKGFWGFGVLGLVWW